MEKRWIWPFELEEQIGSGAMGVVYRARFVKNDRRVALKLLPPDVAANRTLAARFQREMELLKDLRHPNIVHCFGGTCEGDQWFYAMELVEGGNLASLILEQGRLPWRQSIEFGLQMCAALEHAHSRGIIHRDVKPGNMLITKSGKIKLSDFGLAQMQAENKLTAAGKTVGSLHYMAPEQITGKPEMSNRTDLYALGCVLYEMLTGRPPFLGGTVAEVLQKHVRDSPQPLASIALDCPPQLEAIVAELLAKRPDNRPPDATTTAQRLREIDQNVTVKAMRHDRNRPIAARQNETIAAEFRPPPMARRTFNPWLLAALIVCASSAAGLGVLRTQEAETSAQIRAAIADGLQHNNPAVRAFAAQKLGDIGPAAQGAVPELLKALEDKVPDVRAEAARALGRVGGDSSLQARLTSVEQKDSASRVREEAKQSVARLKEPSGGPSIPWAAITAVAIVAVTLTSAGIWAWQHFRELSAES